jgi:3-oxoacyl-[acyl-carrier-protein] synthase II
MAARTLPSFVAPTLALDPARARRLDRPSMMAVSAAVAALAQADSVGSPVDRSNVASVLGTAFASVQASAEYVHRIGVKGPRFAPPADFPNLVPSAPAGHTAMYLHLHGPPMAVSDLSGSGEAAFLTAYELVLAADAGAALAGVTAEKSEIIERVFAPLFGLARGARPEGAAVWVLEDEDALRARGGLALARVTHADVLPWDVPLTLARPEGRVSVFVGEGDVRAREIASRSSFAGDRVVTCAPGAGDGEVVGGIALCAAASSVGAGDLDAALVVGPRALTWGERGVAAGWSYIVLLERASR